MFWSNEHTEKARQIRRTMPKPVTEEWLQQAQEAGMTMVELAYVPQLRSHFSPIELLALQAGEE